MPLEQEKLDAEYIYRANPLLKKVLTPIPFTMEMLREYKKCEKSIAYFIKNYVKIVSLDYGLINFNLWDFQEKMATTIQDNRFTIIKTPRQAGKCLENSTIINIRNKKTGEIRKIKIGDFYEAQKIMKI